MKKTPTAISCSRRNLLLVALLIVFFVALLVSDEDSALSSQSNQEKLIKITSKKKSAAHSIVLLAPLGISDEVIELDRVSNERPFGDCGGSGDDVTNITTTAAKFESTVVSVERFPLDDRLDYVQFIFTAFDKSSRPRTVGGDEFRLTVWANIVVSDGEKPAQRA